MRSRYENRVQLAFALLVGVLLLGNLFALIFVASLPAAGRSRAVGLLVVFAITLLVSLPCALLLPRWLGRPLRRLVGEAERAPLSNEKLARRKGAGQDETEFVLETFQAVVAELRAQQKELARLSAADRARARSAEQFGERIIASIPSGLIAFDRFGYANVINAPARALLEISDDEANLHFRAMLQRTPELAAMIEQTLSHGTLFRRAEVNVTISDKRTLRLGVTVAPIEPLETETHDVNRTNEFASSGGALCLLTDLTEVTQLRETVALKKNLENLGEMSAGLAHEFKNALATLHGYAQLLQNFQLDTRERNASDALLEEVRNLSMMVTAFLNFARPQPLQLTEVELREVFDSCAEELSTFYAARRVELQICGFFPHIHADERLLRQALLNLLRNAAEAISDDKQTRRVTVRGKSESTSQDTSQATDARFLVEITDTGDGIAPEDLQRVFIPFFTTKAGGTGIGLALAHRIITEHGGTLVASNANNGGAIFTISLPIAHVFES